MEMVAIGVPRLDCALVGDCMRKLQLDVWRLGAFAQSCFDNSRYGDFNYGGEMGELMDT